MVSTRENFAVIAQKHSKKIKAYWYQRHQTQQVKKTRNNRSIKQPKNKQTKKKMSTVSPNLLIITLNIHRLKFLIKKYRRAKWIKKQDPTLCCLQKTHISLDNTHRWDRRGRNRHFKQMIIIMIKKLR